MELDLERIAKEIAIKIEEMSDEAFIREVLHLNGVMSQELLDKVFKEAINIKFIDSESLLYKTTSTILKYEEFNDVIHYLLQYSEATGVEVDVHESDFDDDNYYYRYNDKIFRLRELIGQGCIHQLSIIDSYEDEEDILDISIVNTSIRFYKKL